MSDKPAGGVEATLYFPHTEHTCILPALPRNGETLVQEVELSPEENTEATWRVTEVQWHMSINGDVTVGVSLDPADGRTEDFVKRQEAARIAAITRDLDQVLDVEAGLAEVLTTNPDTADRTTKK